MSTFPSVLTMYTDPLPTDRLNAPSHSSIESSQNSGLEAVETFIGTLSSVQGTLMFDIRSSSSNGGGHVQSASKGGTGQTSFNKGDVLIGQSTSVLGKLAVGSDGTALVADSNQALGVKWGSSGKFGGTGADGVFAETSGTTSYNLGGARTFVKNFSSFSLTGTATIVFTNPHANGTFVIFKVSGSVVGTSSATRAIDMRGIGANSGTGGLTAGQDGTVGITGLALIGSAGPGAEGGGGGTVPGTGGSAQSPVMYTGALVPKFIPLVIGGGGGGAEAGDSGGSTFGAGGNGGRGGGSFYMEVAGSYTWSATIDASGQIGVAGANGSARGGGGGGGGGGGCIVILYTSLVSNTGTYTVTGGTGGASSTGGGGGTSAGSGAGGGGSMTAGTVGNAAATNNGGAGGAGGNGFSLVAVNTEFS